MLKSASAYTAAIATPRECAIAAVFAPTATLADIAALGDVDPLTVALAYSVAEIETYELLLMDSSAFAQAFANLAGAVDREGMDTTLADAYRLALDAFEDALK